MTRQQVFDYTTRQFNTSPDYPWNDENAVLRHSDNKKWYAVLLRISRSKLGLTGDDIIDVLNLKCDPMLIGSLLSQEGFHPAYHMNKDKWISIRLDGLVSEEQIQNLIGLSYDLTGTKRKRTK